MYNCWAGCPLCAEGRGNWSWRWSRLADIGLIALGDLQETWSLQANIKRICTAKSQYLLFLTPVQKWTSGVVRLGTVVNNVYWCKSTKGRECLKPFYQTFSGLPANTALDQCPRGRVCCYYRMTWYPKMALCGSVFALGRDGWEGTAK